MELLAAIFYCVLYFGGISLNKYVLSVLGFKYPTIFQGWQTVAGLVIYKLLTVLRKQDFTLTPVDRAGLISIIPGLLFHTTSLISNSKALAEVPIIVYIAVQNILPAGIYLLDSITPGRPPTSPLHGVCGGIVLLTGLGLMVGESSLDFEYTGHFWLLVGVVCSGASILHARIADARFKSWDRLFYSSVFSVVILAPASLYLEEAFQALKFRHDRQELFVTGCLFSAFFVTTINIYSVRLKEDEYFGLVANLASAGTAVLSLFLFNSPLQTWQSVLIGVNLVCSIPLPSHHTRDEDEKPVKIIQTNI